MRPSAFLLALTALALLAGCGSERASAPAATEPAATPAAAPEPEPEPAAMAATPVIEVEFLEWTSKRDTRPAKAFYPTPVGSTESPNRAPEES